MEKRINLINTRKSKNLTHTNMAAILGISTKQYARLEAGTSAGSVKVWQELSKLFGKTIDYLLAQVSTTV